MSFANSSNFTIQGSTFTDINGNVNNYTAHPGERGIRELFKNSCPDAAYDSQSYYPNPRCNPDAHELAVKEVFDWISSGQTKICWVYGAPFTGKSSIAQDIAEQCAQRGMLGASFFFKENIRTTSASLISSIAYQLAITVPQKRLQIGEILENDISILQKPLSIQMHKLIISPFLPDAAGDNDTPPPIPPSPPVLVIIDGIDQCRGEYAQRQIVRLVHEASSQNLPILWLISSRPENSIRQSFDAIAAQAHSISLADIERLIETQHRAYNFTYLRHRFNEIYEWYPTTATTFLKFSSILGVILLWILMTKVLPKILFFLDRIF